MSALFACVNFLFVSRSSIVSAASDWYLIVPRWSVIKIYYAPHVTSRDRSTAWTAIVASSAMKIFF